MSPETYPMKTPFRTLLVLLIITSGLSIAHAATPAPEEAVPELRGILFLSGSRQFALSNPGSGDNTWAALGESFEGWKLVSFSEDDEVLVVTKGGQEAEIRLEASQVLDTDADVQATLEDAQAVMDKINFGEMFSRMMDQQKKSVVAMTRQMSSQMGNGDVSADEVAEFQGKVMDVMWGEIDPKQLEKDMAQIYSELFTRNELRGLSDFYSTPSGQALLERQPEVQQRVMQMIQPRIMAAVPRIQEMARQFAAEHAGAREEAPPAEVTPPSP